MGFPTVRQSYLEGMAGEAEAELPAHYHGLHGAPAVSTHRAPHQRAVSLHQHLDAALERVTASAQTHLCQNKS